MLYSFFLGCSSLVVNDNEFWGRGCALTCEMALLIVAKERWSIEAILSDRCDTFALGRVKI